jgi:hypothetical protein
MLKANNKLFVQVISDHLFADDPELEAAVRESVRRGLTGVFRGFKPADAESAFKLQRSQIDMALQDAKAEPQVVGKDHDFSPFFENYRRLPPS